MKTILYILAIGFTFNFLSAQEAGYRTYSSATKLIAEQGEESYQWENSENTVYLNYKITSCPIRSWPGTGRKRIYISRDFSYQWNNQPEEYQPAVQCWVGSCMRWPEVVWNG